MWWFFVLKAFKTARLSAQQTITHSEATYLISGLLYCAHGNTTALKLINRSFPALFCIRIRKFSLVVCQEQGSGHVMQAWGWLKSCLTERKAPQLSELLRQPKERELSVTGVTTAPRAWRAPGAQQSAFGHSTSKRGYETYHLPRHVALRKGELYPRGSAEAPKKEICETREGCRSAAASPGLGLFSHNSVSH